MAAPTRPTPSTASYLARMGAHTEPTQFLVKNQNKHRHTPRWAADFMNPAAHHHGHIPPPAGLDSPWLRRPTKKDKEKCLRKKKRKKNNENSSSPLFLSSCLSPFGRHGGVLGYAMPTRRSCYRPKSLRAFRITDKRSPSVLPASHRSPLGLLALCERSSQTIPPAFPSILPLYTS